MRIQFERSGGFMGLTDKTSFDLSELPEADAGQLQALVEKANFSALPDNLLNVRPVPDQFTYKISIQTQEWDHTIVTNDASAPPEIQPLIATLNNISRTRRAAH
jgi:Emfourin